MHRALLVVASLVMVLPQTSFAQSASPFVGHWVGSRHCSSGDGNIVLDIAQPPDDALSLAMRADGIGTLTDGRIYGDAITITWSNFLSHVTFQGRFVSADRIEGTYHESITGGDCTWSAVNQTPSTQVAASAPIAQPVASAAPVPQPPVSAQSVEAPRVASADQQARQDLDRWKQHADEDRRKLDQHVGTDSKRQSVQQFCAYSPDPSPCAARIGAAYDYLVNSAFSTLAIASRNIAAPLPPTEPSNGLPSYYDLYQVYMFITRDNAP